MVNVSAHITRDHQIDGMRLLVIDGLFSDEAIRSVYTFLREMPYRLHDIASDETEHIQHWIAEFPPALAEGTPVLRDCIHAARALLAGEAAVINRCYTNSILHGDLQGPHCDPPGGITAVYYANPVWEELWLGETVFYDTAREPVYAVGVKPGRLVLFHSDILHRAGVPSRECYRPRLTTAITFSPARESGRS